ncbi:hypothetical protein [Devosia sp.]|uniref:hypothetical protein n=1 Tax=Devosia sp. TaxID=1871048 RepID=UPI003BAC9AEE
MRLLAISASLPVILGLASGAMAASCGGAVMPDSHSGSLPDLEAPTTANTGAPVATCDASIDVNALAPGDPIPAGTIVVYKAQYRGFLDDGDSAHIAVSHDGVTDSADVSGLIDGDIYFENYIGSGLNGTIDLGIQLSLLEGGSGVGTTNLDSLDFAEAGRTTLISQQASVDSLAAQGMTFVTHLNTTADLLVGDDQPLEAPDSVSLLGALGSHTLGATAHYNLGGGFSIDGGAALFDQEGASGSLFGGSVRYLEPGVNTFRPFAEVGFNAAPGMNLTFSRSYEDGSKDGATVLSETSGSMAGAYVTGGMLFAPDLTNQIAFSGTLMHTWLSYDGYTESFSDDNLFNAEVAGGTGGFDTIKAQIAWTSALSSDLDMTLHAALGVTHATEGVVTDIAFVGPLTGTSDDDIFVQYGARLGWAVTPTTTANVFVNGSSGTVSGTHAQIGAGVRIAF